MRITTPHTPENLRMSQAINNDGNYAVLWPRGPRQMQQKKLAPRLNGLAGKTIAFLWDELFRGDQIFAMIQEELGRRFPDMRFIGWEEFGSSHGDNEKKALAALPQKFKELGVDAVISGMAC